jgi:GST-like protein
MIDLYFWPTPNGHKITLMLEEMGADYTIHPVNITAGEQMKPEFIAISPNNKMPAIVDHDPADGDQPGGGGPLAIFESGAILLYLAKKAKAFAGETLRERVAVKEWLFWQVGGLGPMVGQMAHFTRFAPEVVPYGIKRYTDEVMRLLGVLDRRLAEHEFLAGNFYSVADMASYPWVRGIGAMAAPMLADFAHVRRWHETIAARPATVAAYDKGNAVNPPAPPATPA